MANADMTPYLGVFLDEANEQLAILEQDILQLEEGATTEVLQAIFRAAHTLKGSSRAMGFVSMGELTHSMEDVLDRLRHNALSITQPLIDTLLDALDLLKKQVEEVATRGEPVTDSAELVTRLRALMGGATGHTIALSQAGPLPEASSSFQHNELPLTALAAAAEARQAGCHIFALTIRLADDCLMKSVRALMVMQSLEAIGTLLATTPSEEQIENEEFGREFGIVLATEQSAQVVEQVVRGITEITEVRIECWEITSVGSAFRVLRSGEEKPTSPDSKAGSGPSTGVQEPLYPSLESESAKTTANPTPPNSPSQPPAPVHQTVRVDVVRLDNLLNLVGELVIDQTRIAQITRDLHHAYGGSPLVEHLAEASAHVGRITSMLQAEIMQARMLPIDNVFRRFPRMVRDLAQKLGKEVDFIIEGQETELDRSVIEVIGDPLIHLLRNSLDHGVEMPEERERLGKPRKGKVWLRARHEENFIVIQIEDDGRGMDPEKLRTKALENGMITSEAASRMSDKEALNLIFAPGFSTADAVSEVSGRGVGMDIVKSNLTRFGASIEVESQLGAGSRFTIKLPLTLAIIRGLLVKVASSVYVIPIVSVVETIKISQQDIHRLHGQEVIIQRGNTLPLIRLQRLFEGIQDREVINASKDKTLHPLQPIVIVRAGERQVGLVVDALLGEQEIVIKSLGKFVGEINGLSGATILGDGRIALIVDVSGLLSISTEKRGAYAA